ncbi:MAG: hypothetical protein HQL53_14050 [Magnetococcales bacterium]|nr:hypothetical protein [Magnetococcales bacterium]
MLISQSEWARKKGFSRQYVSKLVKKGVVRLINGKIDPAEADTALEAVREPARLPQRKSVAVVTSAPASSPVPAPRSVTGQSRSVLASGSDLPSGSPGDLPTMLLKARIKSEVKKASLLEIKERVEAGKYVDVDSVKVASFNRARITRNQLLKLPSRVAALVAAESDVNKVSEILTQEIQVVLESLADAAGLD